jgi:hypothetical protein
MQSLFATGLGKTSIKVAKPRTQPEFEESQYQMYVLAGVKTRFNQKVLQLSQETVVDDEEEEVIVELGE